ncbi:hypothetical protein BCR35DRAFT_349119 [Leucosporidium creatinivorum]|uniref:Uncharacterized protein n=1 Tax=Leucosporidium creatinivorum TaxID=106004 RepID=A0A1Y2G8B5_9BASI|nr:hypothetical protein BCR35DRAFT_349119 [Leucosporidium creatinivorum]
MAKGLFTVFHDNTAPPPPTTTTTKPRRTASTQTTNNKPSSSFAIFNDSASSKAGLAPSNKVLGKENIDPFHPSSLAGNKAGLGKKVLTSKLAPPRPSSSSSAAVSKPIYHANSNPICTGLLRTRVLPLPDDPAPAPIPVHTSAPTLPPPSPAYSITSTSSLHSVDALGEGTPNSARDSGYAKSISSSPSVHSDSGSDCDEGTEGWASRREEWEEEKTVRIGEVGEKRKSRRKTKQGLEGISDLQANRLARGLTESPLAEVTQAFTTLGSFSLPPQSPSPSPITHAPSPLSFAKPLRRSSPPPPNPKPYAYPPATQTMRKKKPAPSGSVPSSLLGGAGAGGGEGKAKAEGVRRMRV